MKSSQALIVTHTNNKVWEDLQEEGQTRQEASGQEGQGALEAAANLRVVADRNQVGEVVIEVAIRRLRVATPIKWVRLTLLTRYLERV